MACDGLPEGAAPFTGRERDLDRLLDCLTGGTGPRVAVVGGADGVGKTELAVRAARTARERGWFAGGVLFVDMFGDDPARRVEPGRALAGFLRAVGVRGEDVPAEEDRAGMLRSLLSARAEEGRNVLVVVDNVADVAQAAPLLPAHPACRAIVTSRHPLTGLDAHRIELEALDPGSAVELLGCADDEDARRIAAACGGLPLALRVVAAVLADDPDRPPSAAADALERGGAPVRAALDLAYGRLPERRALLFGLLPLNPGPHFSVPAAAALADRPEGEVRRDLEALASARLIEPAGEYGRWRMHDLVRRYASGRGGPDEEARTRLLEYYLSATRVAGAHIDAAFAWLDVEYPNLLAAAAGGRPTVARDLPAAVVDFQLQRGSFDDVIALSRTAYSAARELGDRQGEAGALTNLGIGLVAVRRFEEAAAAHRRALNIFHEVGDRHGEGIALGNLGLALAEVGQGEDAIAAHALATRLFHATGDRDGEAGALTNLGMALAAAGRAEEAAVARRRAAGIDR